MEEKNKEKIDFERLKDFIFRFYLKFPEEKKNLLKILKNLDKRKIVKTSNMKNKIMRIYLENIFFLLNLKNENFQFSKTNKENLFILIKNILERKNEKDSDISSLEEKHFHQEEEKRERTLLEIHREKIKKNKKNKNKRNEKVFRILNDDRFNIRQNFQKFN